MKRMIRVFGADWRGRIPPEDTGQSSYRERTSVAELLENVSISHLWIPLIFAPTCSRTPYAVHFWVLKVYRDLRIKLDKPSSVNGKAEHCPRALQLSCDSVTKSVKTNPNQHFGEFCRFLSACHTCPSAFLAFSAAASIDVPLGSQGRFCLAFQTH